MLHQRGWSEIRRQKKESTSSNIFLLRLRGNCDAWHTRQLTGGGSRTNAKPEEMEPNKTTEKRQDFFQYTSSTIGRQL